MMTALVAVGGIVLLIGLAISIGASMDTERQRTAARELARERRERNEQLRQLREEWWRLDQQRRRRPPGHREPWGVCDDCPFRPGDPSRGDPGPEDEDD